MQLEQIFGEDWWLDATAPGAWDRVQVSWDNVIVGEMSFQIGRRWGLTFIDMPKLTRTLSPRLNIPAGKPVSTRVNTLSIVSELVARLPRHDRLELALDPDCPSVQGFTDMNFPVMHTFTFRTRPGRRADDVLQDAHQKTRNVVVKAQKMSVVERNTDLDRFLRLHAQEFNMDNRLDYDVLGRAFSAAAARGQAEILFARDEHLRDLAAAIVVGDRNTVYYWLTARDPAHAPSGANSLLIFEALKFADATGRRLDLDGYASPSQGRFLMKFGLDPVVRPHISSGGRAWKCFNALTTLFRPERGDRYFRV